MVGPRADGSCRACCTSFCGSPERDRPTPSIYHSIFDLTDSSTSFFSVFSVRFVPDENGEGRSQGRGAHVTGRVERKEEAREDGSTRRLLMVQTNGYVCIFYFWIICKYLSCKQFLRVAQFQPFSYFYSSSHPTHLGYLDFFTFPIEPL